MRMIRSVCCASGRLVLLVGLGVLAINSDTRTQSSATQKSTSAEVRIQGTVTECWEGSIRTVPDIRVYVLDSLKSGEIRSKLEKMEQLPPAGTTDSVQEFARLYDDLVAGLKLLDPTVLTRTDNKGKFLMDQLSSGNKYLVLAIDWDRGDADQVAYYRYVWTSELKPGTTSLRIYMGPGRRSDCGKNIRLIR